MERRHNVSRMLGACTLALATLVQRRRCRRAIVYVVDRLPQLSACGSVGLMVGPSDLDSACQWSDHCACANGWTIGPRAAPASRCAPVMHIMVLARPARFPLAFARRVRRRSAAERGTRSGSVPPRDATVSPGVRPDFRSRSLDTTVLLGRRPDFAIRIQ